MKGKILIIDDETVARKSLTDILKLEGFMVTEVKNGELGLEACLGDKFDLVLLDIKMPGMDGIEVLVELKKANPHEKVIMLTGHASVHTGLTCLENGANDYCLKPVPLDELVRQAPAGTVSESDRHGPS